MGDKLVAPITPKMIFIITLILLFPELTLFDNLLNSRSFGTYVERDKLLVDIL